MARAERARSDRSALPISSATLRSLLTALAALPVLLPPGVRPAWSLGRAPLLDQRRRRELPGLVREIAPGDGDGPLPGHVVRGRGRRRLLVGPLPGVLLGGVGEAVVAGAGDRGRGPLRAVGGGGPGLGRYRRGDVPVAGRGELVLVVDDEPAVRDATRFNLESHGYRVLPAADGREAVNLFLKYQDNIRLVITDVMMPVMGGAALVRALKTIKADLKVIATTGLDGEDRLAGLTNLGVRDVLPKPCTVEELLRATRHKLDE